MRRDTPDPHLGLDGLTAPEVGAVWDFLHGDIMIPGIREWLRDNWGLCSRHAWGYAVVEIELWEQGAGARHGHQPFDVTVLYQDLAELMENRLRTSRLAPRHVLRRHRGCYICHEIANKSEAGPIGYAGFDSDRLATEANTFEYTRAWLTDTREGWRDQVCPVCRNGATGPRCRLHLEEGRAEEQELAGVADWLHPIAHQLGILNDSMTDHGRRSTPEVDASWVKALGWFHTWDFPLAISREDQT